MKFILFTFLTNDTVLHTYTCIAVMVKLFMVKIVPLDLCQTMKQKDAVHKKNAMEMLILLKTKLSTFHTFKVRLMAVSRTDGRLQDGSK